MGTHPVGQRVDPSQCQPAVEWRGHRAAVYLRPARTLEQIVVVARDQRPANDIAMATYIFGGRMAHHVDSAVERPLQYWRGECPVADRDEAGTALPPDLRDCRQ